MRVLHVMPYIPFPISGSSVRDYNLIKYLNEKKIDSQIICSYLLDSEYEDSMYSLNLLAEELNTKIYSNQIPDLSIIKKIKVVLFNSMYPPICRYNTSINIKAIESALIKSKFDIIDARHTIEAAPVLQAISNSHFKGLKVISLHNVDHLSLVRQIDHQDNYFQRLAYERIISRFKEHELDALDKFDHIFVVSEVDKKIYISCGISKDKIDVVPNGVDCDFYCVEKFENNTILSHPNILFMGSLSYKPNDYGIWNYLKYVHPIIKNKFPNIKLYILGKDCPNWLTECSKVDNSVEIIGFVKDVRPYIFNSDICIAPLMSGSGTRLKILEYMAMSKPVVSTTIGAEGLDFENNKDILIADEWNKYAHLIITLLEDKEFASRIGINGRKLVEKKYDWKNIAELQMNIYKKLVK